MSSFKLTDSFLYAIQEYYERLISIHDIEKDYYICLLLQELVKDGNLDYVLFRGGTSLSKCWKVINRFSEDIDFSIVYPVGEGKRRKFKYNLKSICDSLNLKIRNYEATQSRRLMNRFVIEYPTVTNNANPIIYLEMSAFAISLFQTEKSMQSYIGEYVMSNNIFDLEEYGMNAFTIKTQSLEKTFADKVFALCDYALTGKYAKGSRHIYDLYKIYPKVKDNPELKNIISITRYDRMKREMRPSSYKDSDINEILKEIIETKCFEKDYESKTIALLSEDAPYSKSIKVLNNIIRDRLFEYNDEFDPIKYLVSTKYINKKDLKQMKLFKEYYDTPFYAENPSTPKSIIIK